MLCLWYGGLSKIPNIEQTNCDTSIWDCQLMFRGKTTCNILCLPLDCLGMFHFNIPKSDEVLVMMLNNNIYLVIVKRSLFEKIIRTFFKVKPWTLCIVHAYASVKGNNNRDFVPIWGALSAMIGGHVSLGGKWATCMKHFILSHSLFILRDCTIRKL